MLGNFFLPQCPSSSIFSDFVFHPSGNQGYKTRGDGNKQYFCNVVVDCNDGYCLIAMKFLGHISFQFQMIQKFFSPSVTQWHTNMRDVIT